MAATAKALREERAALVQEARKILDRAEAEKRVPTAEERLAWARIMGDVGPDGKRVEGEEERLKRRIDDTERQEAVEKELAAPAGWRDVGRDDFNGRQAATDPDEEPGADLAEKERLIEARSKLTTEDRAFALQGHLWSFRDRPVSKRHQTAMKKCAAAQDIYRASDGSLAFNLRLDYRKMRAEHRAQSINVNTTGGYTIPEGFVNNLEVALLQYGGIRMVADVMRTTSGNDLPWPTVNDTAIKGSILAENTQINAASTAGDVVFGAVIFHAYKYTSTPAGGGPVLIPVELIEDSAFNLAEEIGTLLGIRIGRITADHFTTGTGTGQPTGILTAATSGVTTASATAIAADEIYNLKHSVDPAYRQGAGFMFHDAVLLAIKKLKDGLGRYLWQASLAGGVPDTLDNDPIQINQSMASAVAASAITMCYGLLSKYKIRDVAEVRMRRLVERYADLDQEGFILFSRHDGNLLDAGTRPVKTMVQHS